MSSSTDLAPVSWSLLLGLGLAVLALHASSVGFLAYGYMSDELYYLDSTARPAWGYVDHPPLSIAILGLVRSLLGDLLPNPSEILGLPVLSGGEGSAPRVRITRLSASST